MVIIRRISSHDVAAYKAVRLAALQDSPLAFGSTFAREAAFSDAQWAQRMELWDGKRAIAYLAWDDGRACGIIGGVSNDDATAVVTIVSMWVAPTHRQRGVGRLLVDGVIQWARDRRAEKLALSVTSANDVAIRFYERLGFRMTGKSEPYPNDPALVEFEMTRPVDRAP